MQVHDPDARSALFIVFSGSNDLADLIGPTIRQGGIMPNTLSALNGIVDGIRQILLAFIAAGAHDILVPNLPDVGQVPLVFSQDPLPGQPAGSKLVATTATALTTLYNTALRSMLEEAEFAGVNIIPFDTFSFLRDVVAHPAAFGLTNVTQG